MKILGILLIVFGVVDLIGSFTEHDIWGDYIGVQEMLMAAISTLY